jgi:hypothetical protein
MLKKFNKDGSLKVTSYMFMSKHIKDTSIYDCWIEDDENYIMAYARTTKKVLADQLETVLAQYFREGYSEVIRVTTSTGQVLYP